MEGDTGTKSTDEIFAEPTPNMVPITAAINRSLATSGVNPYTVRNKAIISKKKRRILYKNGYTLPSSAETLRAEAEKDIKHSRKLGRNLRRAHPNTARPGGTDAHHIVAREAVAAHVSRMVIFEAGIGINDADNGVILPRAKDNRIPGLPNASPHQHIHSPTYHANVALELFDADDMKNTQEIRGILRSIGDRLQHGQFEYL